MPDTMTSAYEYGGRVGRADEEKMRIVEETYLPGNSVSLVARRHGIAGNELFPWRRLMAQGALTAAGAGEEVVPASHYRAFDSQVRELRRLLGKKTMDYEILREAVTRAAGPKKLLLRSSSWPEGAQWALRPLQRAFRARTFPRLSTRSRAASAGDRRNLTAISLRRSAS